MRRTKLGPSGLVEEKKKGAPLVRMTEKLLFLLSGLPQSRLAEMNRGRGVQNGAGL